MRLPAKAVILKRSGLPDSVEPGPGVGQPRLRLRHTLQQRTRNGDIERPAGRAGRDTRRPSTKICHPTLGYENRNSSCFARTSSASA